MVVLIPALFLGYFLVPTFFCVSCKNDVISTYNVPNGKLVVFERNCGATSGYAIHASFIEAGGVLPDEAGNIIRAWARGVGVLYGKNLSIEYAAGHVLKVTAAKDVNIETFFPESKLPVSRVEIIRVDSEEV
ncbi:hypothetical protein SG34_027080 [Thalassomonas viridans]|uniref:Uncharacterized protein n=1 Tax=Thalassomonas viridans TaxID=137584 RepID=A0AAE9Z164_9GAMM|nr:hypothetical protein [Thalassomonas viridans]WDE04926.1 hypothetical protein SG34_027080 [Thalassomonas viridans]